MSATRAPSPTQNGWWWNQNDARLEMYYRGTQVGYINVSGLTVNGTASTTNKLEDGILMKFGTDEDWTVSQKAAILNANTALTGAIVGTPVTPALAANSLVIGGITADGDLLLVAQTGGNSHAFLWYDTSAAILRLYSGAGVEIAKFDSAAYTFTGLGTLVGGFRTSGASHVGFGAGEAVTIASGVATVTKPYVSLAGEGATTDTLDSITYSGQAEGDILLIYCAGNYTITFDNSATLLLGAGTRAMAQGSSMLLIATSATIWKEVCFLTAAS